MTAAPVRAPRDLALAPVVGALALGLVGFLQWCILRRYLDRVRWWAWVGATVLGQFAATVVVILALAGPLLLGALTPVVKYIDPSALQFMIKLITGGLLGAVLGFAQWLALRRHLSTAVWWIPATFLSGAAVGFVTPTGLGLSLGLAPLVTAQLISGVIVGSITGVALVWLLRGSQDVTTNPLAADPVR
jgi:uncharacterized integral membrane protein